MAHRIGPTPQISQPQGNSPEDVRNLGRAFFIDSTDLRARLRDALMKDGSESMEGPLRLGKFATIALPPAASWKGAIAYDTTLNKVVRSDGISWQVMLTAADFGVWNTWAPTYSGSTSGTPTVTTNAALFKQIDKTVFVRLDATITALGGATGNFLVFTLPVTPKTGSIQVISGRETIGIGMLITAQFSTSLATIVGEGAGGTATLVATPNYRHNLSGVYEAN